MIKIKLWAWFEQMIYMYEVNEYGKHFLKINNLTYHRGVLDFVQRD